MEVRLCSIPRNPAVSFMGHWNLNRNFPCFKWIYGLLFHVRECILQQLIRKGILSNFFKYDCSWLLKPQTWWKSMRASNITPTVGKLKKSLNHTASTLGVVTLPKFHLLHSKCMRNCEQSRFKHSRSVHSTRGVIWFLSSGTESMLFFCMLVWPF